MAIITFSLNAKSIDSAIQQVKQYREDFRQKCARFRQMVGERIAWSAQSGFNSALASDVVEGPAPSTSVQVSVSHNDDVTIVFASGDDAVFIEYGAGVYHNGAAGSSPHPWGAEQGYLIGQYGKGKGRYDVWSYYDGGEKVYTMGTPAAMPMYNGLKEALESIQEIAREVFG